MLLSVAVELMADSAERSRLFGADTPRNVCVYIRYVSMSAPHDHRLLLFLLNEYHIKTGSNVANIVYVTNVYAITVEYVMPLVPLYDFPLSLADENADMHTHTHTHLNRIVCVEHKYQMKNNGIIRLDGDSMRSLLLWLADWQDANEQ